MSENPLKIFEKLDPDLLKLVENTSVFALADGVLPKRLKLLIAMALDASHGAVRARDAGLKVVMNRCMMIERKRLEQEEDAELEKIRVKKLQELTTKMKERSASERKESPINPLTLDDAHFDEVVQRHPFMLIDCWAAWCGPCRMIAPIVDELARDYAGRVTVAKLNVDENPETAMRFGIMSIPTLLILKNGKEVDRIIGAVPKEFIEERLRRHM